MTEPRWDLTHFYKDITDPKINADLNRLDDMCQTFEASYSGKLATNLGDALAHLKGITLLETNLYVYVSLMSSTHTDDEDVSKLRSRVIEKAMQCSAHTTFFSIEVGQLSADDINAQNNHAEVAHHAPLITELQRNAQYNLSTEVERALTIRSPFGGREWSTMMDELEGELKFTINGEEMGLSKALNILLLSKDSDERANVLHVINKGFKDQRHPYFMAKTLNVVMGAKAVDDAERGFKNPIDSRNLENHVSKETVDALHQASRTVGAEAAQRFYKLFAKVLGKEKLLWSDRNAPVPFADTREIQWDECMGIVKKAYASFSPTLVKLIEEMEEKQTIDAPVYKGKRGGAFDYTILAEAGALSYNLINYQHDANSVMTTAHELGHGVHGLLAIEAQGALQYGFPLNYAETASIFGEMVTFNHLLDACDTSDQKLALLLSKSQDFLNSAVRQMSFSEFELRAHDQRKNGALAVDDFNKIWTDTTKLYYGEDGDVFNYDGFKDIDAMWCYVSHFSRPFYVYSYAFGELFTQSLFAQKDKMGGNFEPEYLNLLRSAGTKDAVEMMAPFSLNPEDPTFWENGFKVSIFAWLDEIERLMAEKGML